MNPDFSENRPPLPNKLLLAYSDQLLPVEECFLVETEAILNSETSELLEPLRFFSPTNEEFWNLVQIPLPSNSAWTKTFANINNQVQDIHGQNPASQTPLILPAIAVTPPNSRSTKPNWVSRFLALSIAVVGLVFLIPMTLGERNQFPPREPVSLAQNITGETALPIPHSSESDAIVYQIAKSEDVEILSIDESASLGLVIGKHPLEDSPLKLASFEDVDIHAIEPDSHGEFPEIRLTPHGVSMPMIWAVAFHRIQD